MKALILTGPPGVGKTTVAGILAGREQRSVHVEADRFFAFISSGFVEPWDPSSAEQNETAMGIAAAAAASYAEAGYRTIFEGIVIPHWTLGVVRSTFEAAGVPISYAVLRAPDSVCIARVEERNPNQFESKILAALCSEFVDLGEFEHHAVDVAGMDAEQAAAAISIRLADGSLDL